MSIFSSIGRTMNKLPGMGAMTRPISNMMQKTPGMRGAPQALGMTPRPMPKPMGMGVGPSMGMMGQNMAQGGASVGSQMMPQPPNEQMSPMPDIPVGDQASSMYGQKPPQLYGGIGNGQMGGFAGAMGNAMGQAGGQMPGNRFGQMKDRNQQMMQKQGRASGFKPQY